MKAKSSVPASHRPLPDPERVPQVKLPDGAEAAAAGASTPRATIERSRFLEGFHLYSEAEMNSEMHGQASRWLGEERDRTSLAEKASALQHSPPFTCIIILAVIAEIVSSSKVHANAEWLGMEAEDLFDIVTRCVVAILVLDQGLRILGERKNYIFGSNVNRLLNLLEVIAILLAILETVVLKTYIPFTTGRLLRPLVFIRHGFDQLVDKAVDRALQDAIGDIVHITPDNATSVPSKGLVVIEKAHFQPGVFSGIHTPLTVKGGLVELIYIDMDIAKSKESGQGGSQFTVVMRNVLLVLGTDAQTKLGDWRVEDVMLEKNKLVELIAKRTEKVVGKPRRRKKDKAAPKSKAKSGVLGMLREQLLNGPLSKVDLNHVKVDVQNIEIRFEDLRDTLGTFTTIGLQIPSTLLRVSSGHVNELNQEGFRAKPMWDFELDDEAAQQGKPAKESANDEEKKAADDSSSDDEEHAPTIRVAVRCSSLAVWCDYDDMIVEPQVGKRAVNRHINTSAPGQETPAAANYEAFKDISAFSPYFSVKPPKIYEAVKLFKYQRVMDRFKLAAVSSLENRHLVQGASSQADATDNEAAVKPKPPPQPDNDGEAYSAVLEGAPLYRKFRDRILRHRYLLSPMDFSLHCLTTHPNHVADAPPCQVLDLTVPRLNVQIDKDQAQLLRRLQQYLTEWIACEKQMQRMPLRRLNDKDHHSDPVFRHDLVRSWWVYAVSEVSHGMNPMGKLHQMLQVQRLAKSKELYISVVLAHKINDYRNRRARRQRRIARDRNSSSFDEDADAATVTSEASLRFIRSVSSQVSASASARSGSGDLEQGPDEAADLLTIAWNPDMDLLMRRIQVTLPMHDIIVARTAVQKRLQVLLYGSKEDSASASAAVGARDSDGVEIERTGSEGLKTGTPSSPTIPTEGEGAKKPKRGLSSRMLHLRSRRSGDNQATQSVNGAQQGQSEEPQGPEPLQISAYFGRVVAEMLRGQDSKRRRRELVRCEIVGAKAVGKRSPPEEAWRRMTTPTVNVFNHSGRVHFMNQAPMSGPFDGQGQHRSWMALEVSVVSFGVQYCQAPEGTPSLKHIVRRDRPRTRKGPGTSATPQNGMQMMLLHVARWEGPWIRPPAPPDEEKNTGKTSSTRMSLPRQAPRTVADSRPKGPMSEPGGDEGRLKDVMKATAEVSKQAPTGTVCMYLCALRIVEYLKLLKDIQEYLKQPPAVRHKSDNLGLVDHGRRLKALKAKRAGLKADIVAFEKATGLKAKSEDPDQRWKVLISTAPISLTVVAPFVFRQYDRRFLVMHAALPSTRQRMARGSAPPFCGAGVLLPGALDLMASAGALAVGGQAKELPWKGPTAPKRLEGSSSAGALSLDPVVPNFPVTADEAGGGLQEWCTGESVQVFVRTVEPKDLEEELRKGGPSHSLVE